MRLRTDPATIEHILPQNPSDDWSEDFPPPQQESAVDRLGNLTLLEAGTGRDVGNLPFARITLAYANSGYALTKVSPCSHPKNAIALLERQQ